MNLPDDNRHGTPLHRAAGSSHLEAMQALLDNNADPHKRQAGKEDLLFLYRFTFGRPSDGRRTFGQPSDVRMAVGRSGKTII